MTWLFKEEPSHYAYSQLVSDGQTRWSGVRNPLAQKHLRAVKKGDRICYYHTGQEKAVVAVARAASDAYPDPDDPAGSLWAVDIVPDFELPRPVPLAEIKGSPAFADSPLVRMPRLSVMPLQPEQWDEIEALSTQH